MTVYVEVHSLPAKIDAGKRHAHVPLPATPSEQSPLPLQGFLEPPGQGVPHRGPNAPKQCHTVLLLIGLEKSTEHEPFKLLVELLRRQKAH